MAVLASVGLILPIYGITLHALRPPDRLHGGRAGGPACRARPSWDTTRLSDSLGLMCTFLALWLGAARLAQGDWRIAAGLGPRRRRRLPGAARSHPRPAARSRLTWLVGLVPRAARSRASPACPPCDALLVCASLWSAPTRSSKARSPRSWRCGSRPRSGRKHRAIAPGRLNSSRAGSTIRGGTFLPRKKASGSRSTELAIAVGPHRRQVVGGALLALRGHDRLGPGAPAVHPRPLPRSRPGRLERESSAGCLLIFAAVYRLALVRHSVLLGYLSGRHVMALVYASVPWAAAGTLRLRSRASPSSCAGAERSAPRAAGVWLAA